MEGTAPVVKDSQFQAAPKPIKNSAGVSPKGKIGMIDVRDVVDVAVKVLTEDGHQGKTYSLTGPASISFHDVAAALSKALGKEVNYVNVPLEAARQAMISMGLPPSTQRRHS